MYQDLNVVTSAPPTGPRSAPFPHSNGLTVQKKRDQRILLVLVGRRCSVFLVYPNIIPKETRIKYFWQVFSRCQIPQCLLWKGE